MAERTWCPSLGLQRDDRTSAVVDEGYPIDLSALLAGKKTSAKRDAAVAANSGASAQAISGSLTQSFQRRFQKFDAAVVASNANRLYWPSPTQLSALQFGDSLVPADAVVCLNGQETKGTSFVALQLAVPTDSVDELISMLVHRKSTGAGEDGSGEFTGLIGLPPTSHVTSVSELFGSLGSGKAFLQHMRHLTVCDATAGDEASSLADFARQAKSLESLKLINCALRDDMPAFMEALKDSTVSRLDLQRSGIGCGATDADRENVVASVAALLKTNKFLTSLDLSYTSLDATAVAALVGALVESDTQMLPQDMNEEVPDPFDPASIADRLDAAQFVRTAAHGGDGELDGEEAEEEEPAEDAEGGSLVSSHAGDEDDGADDPEDPEAEEGEEDEEDEEANLSSRQNAAAANEQKKRDRERLRAERQQLKRRRHELQELDSLEQRERRALAEAYVAGARDIITSSSVDITKRYGEEKQKAKEAFCARRSGWSRLQALLLRGNHLGDAGVKQIALVLREEVPLSDDEARERQDAADAARTTLGAALGAGRAAITAEEARAWDAIQHAAHNESAAIRARGDDAEEEEEEDEYAKEAPPVVLTNVEGRRGNGDEDEGDAAPHDDNGDDEGSAEEKQHWEEWAAKELPPVTVAPVKKGMRSITLLDLGSCHIGRKGLEALAEVLRTNTTLESLCLRHNPLGGASAKATAATHEDSASAVPASFACFVEMLCVNRSLQTLDLGYCQLGPDHVRAVARALRGNPVLTTLGLEGNQLGVDGAYQQKRHSHSYLHDLWMTAAQPGGTLRHLHLSHNSIALCLWPEEAVALAAACGQLHSLSLCHVGLQASHLQLWAESLQQQASAHQPTLTALQLSRNELAGEAGGKTLSSVLQHFTALEELAVDEHPLLGSAGLAAALEHLPTTVRKLSCVGIGLTQPFVGAAQEPVIPSSIAERLTSLLLGDVEAPTAGAMEAWTAHLAESAPRLQFLSLWARGMAGAEGEVLPLFIDLARSCTSLRYVDCGFKPQFRESTLAGKHFAELERLLLPRRTLLQ